MRRLIVSEFVSVDSVMEAPGGEPGYLHSGWVLAHPPDPGQLKRAADRRERRAGLAVFEPPWPSGLHVLLGWERRVAPLLMALALRVGEKPTLGDRGGDDGRENHDRYEQ